MPSDRALAVGLLLLTAAGCASDDGAAPDIQPRKAGSTTSSASVEAAPAVPARTALVLEDPAITESSGLARSPLHAGVLYTHNDRGSGPSLFAVDRRGTRAVLEVTGVEAFDWEDVATTPEGRIWIADVGDRDRERSWVSVSVLEEPRDLVSLAVPAETFQFVYPDGRHDAEALLVHPVSARIYVVTKEAQGGAVYAAPRRPAQGEVNELVKVADAPPNVTGGDFAPDGRRLVLRNYRRAFVFDGFAADPDVVPLPEQEQGESVTFDATGTGLLVGSEGVRSQVLAVQLATDQEQR